MSLLKGSRISGGTHATTASDGLPRDYDYVIAKIVNNRLEE